MNQVELCDIILGPHVSEKATTAADKNRQIVFKVRKDSNKSQIKKAIELLFEVKVSEVTVVSMKGKKKLHRQKPGRRNDWKKAYVSLVEGHDINFSDTE